MDNPALWRNEIEYIRERQQRTSGDSVFSRGGLFQPHNTRVLPKNVKIISGLLENINSMITTKISVVIPIYQSRESLPGLVSQLVTVLNDLQRPFEIILVDDASPDNAWEVIKSLKEQYPSVLKIIRLAVNSGQHNAILCGFAHVDGDVVVTMDDDLQNPPEEVPKLIAAVDEGYELVIGAYDSKKHDMLRNRGGDIIDTIQRRIFGLPRDFQLTSFRAISRAVVDRVSSMGGVFPYVTCMLLSNTSSYVNVPVHHAVRRFGGSNYTLHRSARLAANLLLNYSAYPFYAVAFTCILSCLFCVFYGFLILLRAVLVGFNVPGWATLVLVITLLSSLTLFSQLIMFSYIFRMSQQLTRTRISYAIREIHE